MQPILFSDHFINIHTYIISLYLSRWTFKCWLTDKNNDLRLLYYNVIHTSRLGTRLFTSSELRVFEDCRDSDFDIYFALYTSSSSIQSTGNQKINSHPNKPTRRQKSIDRSAYLISQCHLRSVTTTACDMYSWSLLGVGALNLITIRYEHTCPPHV